MIPPMSEPDILGIPASHFIAAMDELTDARAKLAAIRALCDEDIARQWSSVNRRSTLAILDAPSAAEPERFVLADHAFVDEDTFAAAEVARVTVHRKGTVVLETGDTLTENSDGSNTIYYANPTAEPDPLSVGCPKCQVPAGWPCSRVLPSNICPERIAAARKDTQ
jgi:hypothetical protein